MKLKLLLVLSICLLLVGCGSNKEELKCDMGATTITITIQKGKIISYYDEIEGDLSQDEIDVLNESHLKDITNNQEALDKLRDVIASSGGNCNSN